MIMKLIWGSPTPLSGCVRRVVYKSLMTTSTPSFPPVDDMISLVKKIDWTDVRKRARKGLNNCGLVLAVIGEKVHDFGAFLAQLWYVFTTWSWTMPMDPWGSGIWRGESTTCLSPKTRSYGRAARDTRPATYVVRSIKHSPPFGGFFPFVIHLRYLGKHLQHSWLHQFCWASRACSQCSWGTDSQSWGSNLWHDWGSTHSVCRGNH